MKKEELRRMIERLLEWVAVSDEATRIKLLKCSDELRSIYNNIPDIPQRPDSPCPCGCNVNPTQ